MEVSEILPQSSGIDPRPLGVRIAVTSMGKPTNLQSSGSTPRVGTRMSGYA